MGLDAVELVMRVEDTFGIKIEDHEYENVKTVGDLHKLVVRNRGRVPVGEEARNPREAPSCLSLLGFLQLRRALTSLLNLPRRAVRPLTPLDTLFPRDQRPLRLGELERVLNLRFPVPKRPPWMQGAFVFAWLALILGTVPLLAVAGDFRVASLFGLITFAALLRVAWRFTAPYATFLEPALCTVGGLAKRIVALNYAHLDSSSSSRADDVMLVLIEIISDTLGIPAEQIAPDKRFVEDLLCD